LGHVDGVISDDSDVWPFGARCVYRNMFSRRKHVQEYKADIIFRNFGLTRSEFIQIALISGGDYTKGLSNIGIVAAIELITEFTDSATINPTVNQKDFSDDEFISKALSSLKRMREWLCCADTAEDNPRKGRLKNTIISNNEEEIIKMFPNIEIFNSYSKPDVHSEIHRFQWGRVDFAQLNQFLVEKIGLDEETLDKKTHGALKCWDDFQKLHSEQKQYQTRIPVFLSTKRFEIEEEHRKPKKKSRLFAALNDLRKRNQKEE